MVMGTPPAPTFGVLLRQARRAAGFTQKELATRARISADAISVLERGLTRAPHQETLNLLAEALQLAPAERVQWEQATQGMRLPGFAPEPPDGLDQELACPLPGIKRQLPIPATPLIGREHEVRALCALLQRPETRLLTVTGSAGVGKTRLALQVAADLAETFADGVQFVPLAALNDPALVPPTLAQALRVRESGALPTLTLLTTALREQQILLVLDNFEHVIAAAPHLAALLEACPGVKILVTSREVLRLRAEQQFVAPPLALPELPPRAAPQQMDSAALEKNPAMQLFLQRVQAAQPGFHLTPDNAAIIAEICHRLEGIPLAIELAAPRLKLLSPQALLARMEDRLQVLTGGARDLPERQRTMRATIAWSYELLSPDERALFRRLAVFMGGWTLEAAEQVCREAGALKLDMLEGLSSLLDKSLVSQEPASNGETRFRMLYVLREFGLEQLGAEGEETITREAHATYYLSLVEETYPQQDGAEQQGRRNRLRQEHDNLRAALNWWLGHAEQAHAPEAAEHALRLWWSMSPFWLASCYREGYASVKRILAVRAGVSKPVQVKALLYAASVLRAVGEVEQAEALAQEALALARQTEDLPGIAFALQNLGVPLDTVG
jgi:predicted ATPase/transcriptional regulator with XRE-family HTH domain